MIEFENGKEQKISFPKNGSYRLHDLQGLGGVSNTLHTLKAFNQDGETYMDSDLETRALDLTFSVFADNETELEDMKREVYRVFNPKTGKGKLYRTVNGGTYFVECLIESGPHMLTGKDNRGNGYQRFTVDLLAPLPYWLEEVENNPLSVGGLTFPVVLPSEFATIGQERVLDNSGDVATPVTVELTGYAKNPTVTNETTGEFLKVNREILSGETLVINTAFGNKKVVIRDDQGNETNAFNYIDLNSTFWSLETGQNTISYATESGDQASMTVKWNNRYLGVG